LLGTYRRAGQTISDSMPYCLRLEANTMQQ
jgi:hypothetical protein